MDKITNCKNLAEILSIQAMLLQKAVALRDLGELKCVSSDTYFAPYLKTVEVTVDKYEPSEVSWKATTITQNEEGGLDYNSGDALRLNSYLDFKIAEARAKAEGILSCLADFKEEEVLEYE